MLITSVYLFDVVDTARTSGTHGGNQQGNTGTDIRTRHPAATQCDLPVVSHDDSSVGITQDDLGAHVDEFVHEEQATLKHLLVEQYTASGLSGHHDEH